MNLTIIGCGGVGGWVLQNLSKNLKDCLTIFDGDTVEKRNLDRQLFHARHIHQNKAKALNEALHLRAVVFDCFFGEEHADCAGDILFCCADNNTARLDTLAVADRRNIPAIIGANDIIDAEAYIYFPQWKDTDRDPRKYYPVLLDYDPYDPRRPKCNDAETIEAYPQLPLANMLSASYLLWLYNCWMVETVSRDMDKEAIQRLPYKINSTFGRIYGTN